MEKNFESFDAFPFAYLVVVLGITPTLVRRSDKLLYAVPASDTVLKALRDYNAGAVVDALRFSAAVKSLRSQLRTQL